VSDDTTNMGHILVVDDDPAMQQMIADFFADQNIPTSFAAGQAGLVRHLAGNDPSLIILDLKRGQEDGLDLLRSIRSDSDVPVIIITGHCLDEVDRIVGLELGADDYLVKPFSVRELYARARAVWRRQEVGRAARVRDPERGGYRFGGWRLHRRGRQLIAPDGSPIALKNSEYALLLAFLDAPQRTLTREFLLQATQIHEDVFDRSIDVRVLRLRRKLETYPGAPRVIQTVRSLGYVFTLSVKPL